MAGAGRRIFQPGEVLTATNVQTYLMDQTVQYYAGTAARGSAIGTATTEGMVAYLADQDRVQIAIGTATWMDLSVPPGALMLFATSAAPTGWLIADGAAISRTTYAALFDAIGGNYGAGNGSTTFNIPDLRGRVPVGKAASGTFGTLANTGGAETHTLSTAEMPSHTHGPSGFTYFAGANNTVTYAGGSAKYSVDGLMSTTGSTGGGGSHNNLQPYQVVNFCIKY